MSHLNVNLESFRIVTPVHTVSNEEEKNFSQS